MTNTEDPRDILLLLDGTCRFREECDPELVLHGGNCRVIDLIKQRTLEQSRQLNA
jgi:hypothetical protein